MQTSNNSFIGTHVFLVRSEASHLIWASAIKYLSSERVVWVVFGFFFKLWLKLWASFTSTFPIIRSYVWGMREEVWGKVYDNVKHLRKVASTFLPLLNIRDLIDINTFIKLWKKPAAPSSTAIQSVLKWLIYATQEDEVLYIKDQTGVYWKDWHLKPQHSKAFKHMFKCLIE